MRKWQLISALCALCAVIGVLFGITKAQESKQLTRAIGSMYERALYEIAEGVDSVAQDLEKILVINDAAMQGKLLGTIGKKCTLLGENLASLPVSEGAVQEVMACINRLGAWCDAGGGSCLTEAQRNTAAQLLATMDGLRANVSLLRRDLQSGQLALHTPLEDGGGYPADALGDPAVEYPTLIYDGPFSQGQTGPARALTGPAVDEAAAAQRVLALFETGENAHAAQEIGGEIPAWYVELACGEENVYAAVTKTGGHILWLMRENEATTLPALGLHEARQRAEQTLASLGYEAMAPTHWQLDDGIAVFAYVATQDGVLLYPDMVKVQIRLSDGALMALETGNFVRSHTQRSWDEPTVAAQDAAALAQGLTGVETALCIAPTATDEALCWQISGRKDGHLFYIFVDAHTGRTIDIMKVIEDESGLRAV